MALYFFMITALGTEQAWCLFCRQNTVLAIATKQFVADGQHRLWVIYLILSSELRDSLATGGRKFRTNTEARIDYKTMRSEETLMRCARWRALHKKMGSEHGITLYNVSTNAQIAVYRNWNTSENCHDNIGVRLTLSPERNDRIIALMGHDLSAVNNLSSDQVNVRTLVNSKTFLYLADRCNAPTRNGYAVSFSPRLTRLTL